MNSEELLHLFSRGFKQEYPNDPSWPHISFRLKVQNHYWLTNVAVVVADNEIQLLCADCTSDHDKPEICVMRRKYSRIKLDKLLGELSF